METLLKTFLIDGIVFCFLILFILLCSVIANSMGKKKGKKTISLGKVLKKYIVPLIPLFAVVFIVHLVLAYGQLFLSEPDSVLYAGNQPLLRFIVTSLKTILPFIVPFVLPVLIVLAVIILGYGIIGALSKLSEEEVRSSALNQEYRFSFRNFFFYFIHSAERVTGKIVEYLPKICVTVAVFIAVNFIFVGITKFGETFENLQKIKELKIVVKNLSRSDAVAKITLMNKVGKEKNYKIEMLALDGSVLSEETVTLVGDEIAVDFININFDYSEIKDGEQTNLAFPYRVYSEYLAPNDGIELHCVFNGEKVPVMYSFQREDIYGISESDFHKRLGELFEIIQNEEQSRLMGIRSTVGNVPHFVMSVDEEIIINVEGTGGLSISRQKPL